MIGNLNQIVLCFKTQN